MTGMNRREFLQGLAGAAVVATAGGSGRAGDLPKPKFRLNLNCGQIGVRATPAEAIRLAGKHGYKAVTPMSYALAKMPDEQLTRLLGEMKAAGLEWGAAPIGPFFQDDEAQFKERFARIARDAKLLQRARVTRSFTWVMPSSNTRTYRAQFRLVVRRTREVGKLLADHNVRIGLEYLGTKTLVLRGKYPFVQTLAEMKELAEETGLDNVGLALDAWHWWQAGDTEEDIATLTNRQAVCADLCDAPTGTPRHQMPDSPRKLPCTTGVIDLKPFLRGLVRIGFDGPLGTEPFDKTLRKLPTDQALATATAAMNKARALLR